ncbi:MAG: A/G-specific adenine glycosylase [Flavobacteriales bacterium]|nr:A/G-specific adenine glycosylase [Flavobacteriales bacterium]
MEKTTENLLIWYAKHKRNLPWRESINPYQIWLSEIILQQTRVDQGTAYYLRFISAFPTVFDLAKADEESVLKLWQGLGYYSRARNLRLAAQMVVEKFNGQFPTSYDLLLTLKGVGPYTAAAIASIAFNEPVPVVDGNVFRVISRLMASDLPIDRPSGLKFTREQMLRLIPSNEPGNFNQAVMELGAMVCKPVNPDCNACPIQTQCLAHASKITSNLPVKAGKQKVTALNIRYAMVIFKDQIMVRLRSEKGIWQGLYDFPELTFEHDEIGCLHEAESLFGTKMTFVKRSSTFTHLLSHRRISADVFVLQAEQLPIIGKDCQLIALSALTTVPVPRLVEKMLPLAENLI